MTETNNGSSIWIPDYHTIYVPFVIKHPVESPPVLFHGDHLRYIVVNMVEVGVPERCPSWEICRAEDIDRHVVGLLA
jgi:hypothetical protein